MREGQSRGERGRRKRAGE